MATRIVGFAFDNSDIGIIAERHGELITSICNRIEQSSGIAQLRQQGWQVLGVMKRKR